MMKFIIAFKYCAPLFFSEYLFEVTAKNLSQYISKYISKYLVKQQTRESDVYSKITRFNAVNVMLGLVLLCATWICCINYRGCGYYCVLWYIFI